MMSVNFNDTYFIVDNLEDGKDIEKDIQFKHKHQRFYTGTFSNSNVYLKQTKQKELMDNLNLTYIHYKDHSCLSLFQYQLSHLEYINSYRGCQLGLT
mgnify:CR=1 FL=1